MGAAKSFVRDNLVLIVGLTLPVLMMAGFLAASTLSRSLTDPPKHDLVFAVSDYSLRPAAPVSVRLIVDRDLLKAQYTTLPAQVGGSASTEWKKLFIYDAPSRTVRELPFDVPGDAAAIQGTRVDVVDSTKALRLSPSRISPDGYELVYPDGSGGGLFTELFFARRSRYTPRLKKGGSSVPLVLSEVQAYQGQPAEFVGWVTARR
jgi:hypothetical protein